MGKKITILLILCLALVAGTLIPKGSPKEIVVTSTADSGSGTLREALLQARPGDIITFDPKVFPPDRPATILLRAEDHDSALPNITQGGLTIDASDAGVILDGRNIQGDWVNGLEIYSDGNVIQGLQIINFSGSGIVLCTASHNRIGGDRDIGSGPIGQGNLLSRNGVGLNLCVRASHNIITGNLIGTDPTGTKDWGNRIHGGIWIESGVNDNTIGPDNIIAYNGENGILITGPDASGNTITQNSIHDNRALGIAIRSSRRILHAPTILDFDVSIGTLLGVTCANCTVEIFSDREDEGKIYEGRVTSNDDGVFMFEKGAPLVGPHVTATATDSEGNTSQFSFPVLGDRRILTLQEGNGLPKTKLQTEQPRELEDNHIGGGIGSWEWEPGADNSDLYESLIADIRDLGIKWFHTGFESHNPLVWQWVLRAPSVYEIPQDVDEFITALSREGVNIVLNLGTGMGLDRHEFGPDCWGDPGWGVLGQREPHRRFTTAEERNAYIEYVSFMVNHFKGRIHHYEIWNEPNIQWSPDVCYAEIAVEDYAALVRETAPVIRRIDPDAKIIAGAVALFGSEQRAWLLTMLRNGVAPLIDGISWHPFFGTGPETCVGKCPEPRYWETYPANVIAFKGEAALLGFNGDYYVDEMVWRSNVDFVPSEPPIYTESQAAKLAARANVLHLGLGFEEVGNQLRMPAWISRIPRYYVIRNLSTVMAGARPVSLPVTIETRAREIKSYAFSLPNGDKLLALWTDRVAVDYDPGMEATLVFPGFSARRAIGIDVLYGFEQELITDVEDGSLVIRNLLIKDYPIILRLIH